MSTVKLVLRAKSNKDGTMPIALRITKNRKSSFIHLGYSIKEDDWDSLNQRVKKSHPNHARLNNFLIKKLSEATDGSLELETNKNHLSPKTIKNKIKPSGGTSFFPQAKSYLDRLKASGKYNQYTADKPRVEHFKKFIGQEIGFDDITPTLLERFKGYAVTKLNLGERSAVNCLVMVRSVFSQAIKDNVIDPKYYPFGKGKMKIKFPETVKIGLSTDEILSLEEVELTDPAEDHARNLWLTSFYFAGMRISDVLRLRWSDLQDNRLHYAMGKNNKAGSLKIPDKALNIINRYEHLKRHKDDLIFPELKECDFSDKFKTQRTIAFKTSSIDKCLRKEVAPQAEIEKKLTMHIARHSFAQIATEIDVRTLQKLFRHTKLETTEGYMGHFIHQKADDALDVVLNMYKNEKLKA